MAYFDYKNAQMSGRLSN